MNLRRYAILTAPDAESVVREAPDGEWTPIGNLPRWHDGPLAANVERVLFDHPAKQARGLVTAATFTEYLIRWRGAGCADPILWCDFDALVAGLPGR